MAVQLNYLLLPPPFRTTDFSNSLNCAIRSTVIDRSSSIHAPSDLPTSSQLTSSTTTDHDKAMTLADILKPSAIVLGHSQVRGVQLGAGAGALAAIPCLLLRPSLVRDGDEPALATLASLAGAGAAVGMGAAAVSCAYQMSRLGKAGVADRAESLTADTHLRRMGAASGVGQVAGVALAAARVWSAAKRDGKCVFGVAFRKETAWEVFAFGSLGIAVGAGVYCVGKVVCEKFDKGKVAEVCEVDEGEVVVDSGKESAEEELKKTEE